MFYDHHRSSVRVWGNPRQLDNTCVCLWISRERFARRTGWPMIINRPIELTARAHTEHVRECIVRRRLWLPSQLAHMMTI